MAQGWVGEEFLVVFPNTDLKEVNEVLSRIMEDWLGERPDGKPLTASIGVSEWISDSVADWPQFLDLSDQRMYLANKGGRARAALVDDEELSRTGRVDSKKTATRGEWPMLRGSC